MQCFIIEGSKQARDAHILEFITLHSIKNYYTIKFEEKMLIAMVRQLIKTLSSRLPKNEKRLVLIDAQPTLEAQNALLKHLEEINNDTFLFFCISSKDLLLPTIISRCSIITVDSTMLKSDIDEVVLRRFISAVQSNQDAEALILAEMLPDIKSPKMFAELIMGLREHLIKKIYENSFDHTGKKMVQVLKAMTEMYPLISKNNVNLRLAIEAALLQ